jgi:hypothetical protein
MPGKGKKVAGVADSSMVLINVVSGIMGYIFFSLKKLLHKEEIINE